MYGVNENVVYPGHGVARIERIIEKRIGNRIISFYELKLLSKGMTILTPTANAEAVGIRPLSSYQEIDNIFKKLMMPARKNRQDHMMATNWNRRNKEYQLKLRTGSLIDISEIYHDLLDIARTKELSFGEKTLLQQTEALLAEEISAVHKLEGEKALEHLRSIFVQRPHHIGGIGLI